MTDEELIRWITETEVRHQQLPAALALLTARGMTYGQIAQQTGGRKGTVYRRVKRATRRST